MYDQIKVGDLVFLKRSFDLKIYNSIEICTVFYKEERGKEFLFKLFCNNTIVIYDTSHYHRNTSLEMIQHV